MSGSRWSFDKTQTSEHFPKIFHDSSHTLDTACGVMMCVAGCCSVLQCVAVCCSVLQCVAVCCSVLQCATNIS